MIRLSTELRNTVNVLKDLQFKLESSKSQGLVPPDIVQFLELNEFNILDKEEKSESTNESIPSTQETNIPELAQ
ncbi:MAG TPA: hypothetical protein VHA52_03740, partial [Candidatus Babeliaceae bacterium]|nr:hypothetical protein [Candidatus Babeliaceae bacterium]